MLTSSLRSRLSRIARGIGTAPAPAFGPPALEVEPAPAVLPEPEEEPFLVAFDFETAGTERATAVGSAWEVRVPLAGLLPDHADRCARLHAGGLRPCLFLDIETAGLAAA